MTSSSDTFPFGIADVVELLGLTVRRRLPSSLYLNCPFCGDLRGRLNVNTDKNVWRCNRCGAAGGMLALYARYNCTSNADACGGRAAPYRGCQAFTRTMPGGGRSTSAAARRVFCSRLSVWTDCSAVCRYGWTRRCAAGMTHRAKAGLSISGCPQ